MEDECVVALPNDLWGIIGSKLEAPSDRSRFRAVSKPWKSLLPFRQPPWLMLAESKINNDGRRGVVSLGEEEKVYQIDLPELHQARCVGSTGNWLSTVHLEKTISLLNPFTRLQFHLPPPTTLKCQFHEEFAPEGYRDHLINKIILSSPPDQHNCIAVALYHYCKVLAFARPGDASWTSIQVTDGLEQVIFPGIDDMIFYNEKLYALNFFARLMVCDIHGDVPNLSYITDALTGFSFFEVKYLAECSGELLMVNKSVHTTLAEDDDPVYTTTGFRVYKLDWGTMKFNEVYNLGDHSLFLGFNTSISLLASDYYGWIKRNCIYFTDDFTFGYRTTETEGGRDMGVFDLEDNSITPHFGGLSTSLYSPPVWIIPP